MMVAEPAHDELVEAWSLVDELGDLSLRLRRAAECARESLGLPDDEEST